ncbi:hypothetical protein LTR86_006769 [Recurvomyces mirabilis]|nr:hypothetical protein LTR86_006769 [Recurvomyces mirabilis]
MWLINTQTQHLQSFTDANRPRYAILSHTWEDDEVTFQDMRSTGISQARTRQGYQKIAATCSKAIEEGLQWAWVDTCCIDKSNSAELSEAINSMFRWYNEAEICYAYLSDVYRKAPKQPGCIDESSFLDATSKPRWFSRGWTLQEMIAPATIQFYNRDWEYITSRHQAGRCLTLLTGVDEAILHWSSALDSHAIHGEKTISAATTKAQLRASLDSFSAAQRLSWAASRSTTRIEDRAYSLLGIFDINLPLIYGEGERAFVRIQEEILRVYGDDSILAWDYSPDRRLAADNVPTDDPGWLFAPSPEYFQRAHNITRCDWGSQQNSDSLQMTPKGLRTDFVVVRSTASEAVVLLNCSRGGNLSPLCLHIVQEGAQWFVATQQLAGSKMRLGHTTLHELRDSARRKLRRPAISTATSVVALIKSPLTPSYGRKSCVLARARPQYLAVNSNSMRVHVSHPGFTVTYANVGFGEPRRTGSMDDWSIDATIPPVPIAALRLTIHSHHTRGPCAPNSAYDVVFGYRHTSNSAPGDSSNLEGQSTRLAVTVVHASPTNSLDEIVATVATKGIVDQPAACVKAHSNWFHQSASPGNITASVSSTGTDPSCWFVDVRLREEPAVYAWLYVAGIIAAFFVPSVVALVLALYFTLSQKRA